jgi:hypothetical protein
MGVMGAMGKEGEWPLSNLLAVGVQAIVGEGSPDRRVCSRF